MKTAIATISDHENRDRSEELRRQGIGFADGMSMPPVSDRRDHSSSPNFDQRPTRSNDSSSDITDDGSTEDTMAKRFTDTKKWEKAWFRTLSPRMKCAWDFLNSKCDFIGLWELDLDRLAFEIGESVTLEELTSTFDVEPFDGDKLFIPGFVPFQYGDVEGKLSEDNRMHQNVAAALKSRGLPVPEMKPSRRADPGPAPGRPRPQGKGIRKGKGNTGGVGENADPFSALVTRVMTAVKKHPPGDEGISSTIGPDWAWIAKSGLMPAFRQAKDDDFTRRRLASDLRAARERIEEETAS